MSLLRRGTLDSRELPNRQPGPTLQGTQASADCVRPCKPSAHFGRLLSGRKSMAFAAIHARWLAQRGSSLEKKSRAPACLHATIGQPCDCAGRQNGMAAPNAAPRWAAQPQRRRGGIEPLCVSTPQWASLGTARADRMAWRLPKPRRAGQHSRSAGEEESNPCVSPHPMS